MADLADYAKREVGGVPVAGWVAVLAVGLVVGRKIASGGGLFQPKATLAPVDYGTGYNAAGGPATSTTTTGTSSGPADNSAWSRLAIDYLISTGAEPVAASRAIGRYLSGDTITETERAMIAQAIRQIGTPPEGVPVGSTTPKPLILGGTIRAGVGEDAYALATRIRAISPQIRTSSGLAVSASWIAARNKSIFRGNLHTIAPTGAPIVY